jgi:hypothetical protein
MRGGDDASCHAGCMKSESIHRAPTPAMPWPHRSASVGPITGAAAVARMLFQSHAQPAGTPRFSGRLQGCDILYTLCRFPVFNRGQSGCREVFRRQRFSDRLEKPSMLSVLILRSKPLPGGRRLASRRMAACAAVVGGHPSRRIAAAMLLRMRAGEDDDMTRTSASRPRPEVRHGWPGGSPAMTKDKLILAV